MVVLDVAESQSFRGRAVVGVNVYRWVSKAELNWGIGTTSGRLPGEAGGSQKAQTQVHKILQAQSYCLLLMFSSNSYVHGQIPVQYCSSLANTMRKVHTTIKQIPERRPELAGPSSSNSMQGPSHPKPSLQFHAIPFSFPLPELF